MNLVMGKTVRGEKSGEVLSLLKGRVLETLQKGPLDFRRVVDACDRLSESLNQREHLSFIMQLGPDEKRAAQELAEVKRMLSKEVLLHKVKTELGEDFIGSMCRHMKRKR